MANQKIDYNDHSIRIVLSLVAANIILIYNDGQSFFAAILSVSYIRSFIILAIISYLIIYFIHYITVRLDAHYDWHSDTLLRFLWQTFLGLLVPAILFYFCISGFFYLDGTSILETDYLQKDYPMAIFMLMTLNLYYFGLYSYLRLAAQRSAVQKTIITGTLNQTVNDIERDTVKTEENPYKEVIMVATPTKTLPVASADIAYAYRKDGLLFLRLTTMESINESYQVNYTLKELESLLDPAKFFRINRQMLISYESIEAFQPLKNKTISVTLNPPLYKDGESPIKDYEKLAIVSEDRTRDFRSWMDR